MSDRPIALLFVAVLLSVLIVTGCGVSHQEPPPPEEPEVPPHPPTPAEVPADTTPQPPQDQPGTAPPPSADEPPTTDTPPRTERIEAPPEDTGPKPTKTTTPSPDTPTRDTAAEEPTPALPFQPGERLTYSLTYTGIPLATLKLRLRDGPVRGGNSTFEVEGSLKTRGVANWIVTIKDRIRSVFNRKPLFSWSYIHRENHNGDRDVESSLFDQTRMIITDHNDDTTPLEKPVHDPVSAFYSLRALSHETNDAQTRLVFLDGELYNVKIQDQGRDRLYTVVGRLWAHKFHVTTTQDELSEKMKEGQSGFWIWVTEQRGIPVQIRIPAAVGSIWVELDQYRPGSGSETETQR